MFRRLSLRVRVAIFVAVVVLVGAVVVIAVAHNDSRHCPATVVRDPPDLDRPNSEAFAIFIAEQEESPLPLDVTAWRVASDDGVTTIYRSDVNGHWQVTVSRGSVRNYGCA